tara:strand:+ start:675 stop:908 length:234 start_codon:yes stop_codon:yes gene_type:complete
MLIHWRIDGPTCGERTGTCLPEQGESWNHMVRFLRMSEPTGWLVAYSLDGEGNEVDFHDSPVTVLCEDNDPEGWFSS